MDLAQVIASASIQAAQSLVDNLILESKGEITVKEFLEFLTTHPLLSGDLVQQQVKVFSVLQHASQLENKIISQSSDRHTAKDGISGRVREVLVDTMKDGAWYPVRVLKAACKKAIPEYNIQAYYNAIRGLRSMVELEKTYSGRKYRLIKQ